MGTKLAKVLDECIARIRKDEIIETCLAQYAHVREQAAKSGKKMRLPNKLAMAWQSVPCTFTPARKVAIPIALALLLTIGASFGAFNFLSPSPALNSQCTLSILNGSAEVQGPDSDNWEQGTDGMTLIAGTTIRTPLDSHALLTFFEGSTLKLDPGTDIEIQQAEYDDLQSTTIALKQWMGRTWSRIVIMTSPGSHYQIETPSASAIVRG